MLAVAETSAFEAKRLPHETVVIDRSTKLPVARLPFDLFDNAFIESSWDGIVMPGGIGVALRRRSGLIWVGVIDLAMEVYELVLPETAAVTSCRDPIN